MAVDIRGDTESTHDRDKAWWVLVPGIAVGAMLGFAEHIRRTTGNPRGRWLVWSPFAFAGILVAELIIDGPALRGGTGGGALALPTFAVAGAYAIAGHRPLLRVLCGLLGVSAVPIWALSVASFGSPSLALTHPKGAWISVYFWSFLALLMIGTAIPLRIPTGDDSAERGPTSRHHAATH